MTRKILKNIDLGLEDDGEFVETGVRLISDTGIPDEIWEAYFRFGQLFEPRVLGDTPEEAVENLADHLESTEWREEVDLDMIGKRVQHLRSLDLSNMQKPKHQNSRIFPNQE